MGAGRQGRVARRLRRRHAALKAPSPGRIPGAPERYRASRECTTQGAQPCTNEHISKRVAKVCTFLLCLANEYSPVSAGVTRPCASRKHLTQCSSSRPSLRAGFVNLRHCEQRSDAAGGGC